MTEYIWVSDDEASYPNEGLAMCQRFDEVLEGNTVADRKGEVEESLIKLVSENIQMFSFENLKRRVISGYSFSSTPYMRNHYRVDHGPFVLFLRTRRTRPHQVIKVFLMKKEYPGFIDEALEQRNVR